MQWYGFVRSRRAFSLIELLLVLGVMSIMLTVVTSSFWALRRNAEVRGGVDRFIARYSLARATAVRMGRTAQLRSDTAGQRIWVEVQGTTIGGVTHFRDVHFRTDRLVLCFDARGLATTGGTCESPAATVVFTHGGRADTLRTTLVGRVMR